jgi:hypothetical protein
VKRAEVFSRAARALLDSRLAWLLLLCGLLWVAGRRASEALARDPRFLARPEALRLPAPAWGGDEVIAPVRERLLRLGPVNLFDPRFEERIRGAVEPVPGVARVTEIRRFWPNRYGISFRLHRPVAVVRQGNDEIPVTGRGVALPPGPYARASAPLFRITGVREPAPPPGTPWPSEALADGLAALAQIAPHLERVRPLLLDRVDVAGAHDPRRGVVLRGGAEINVLWGRPRSLVGENPVDKKVRLLAIAADHADAVRGYDVDVRFDSVFLRESPVE